METDTILIIVSCSALGILLGYIIAKALEKNNASKIIKNAKEESNSIIRQANAEGEAIKKGQASSGKGKIH